MNAASFAINFYFDYVNNYLSLEKIAEHHGISHDLAYHLVKEGKELSQPSPQEIRNVNQSNSKTY